MSNIVAVLRAALWEINGGVGRYFSLINFGIGAFPESLLFPFFKHIAAMRGGEVNIEKRLIYRGGPVLSKYFSYFLFRRSLSPFFRINPALYVRRVEGVCILSAI